MKHAYEMLLKKFTFTSDDSAIVAVSGGPDSMALLSLLRKIHEKTGLHLVVAHVNHNTGRAGQKSDHLFVKEYCEQNKLTFEDYIIEEYQSDNFHQEAHQKRYQFFETLLKKYHANYLFTAHHGDDLMETILMRIVRGSTLKGYSGFSEITEREDYQIIRPFLFATKEELLSYCQQEKIPYVIDDSNEKEVYTRNRYRKNLLPFLKQEDANVHERFYKFSKTLLEYDTYIERQVEELLRKKKILVKNELRLNAFLTLDPFLSKRILFRLFEQSYQENLMLVSDHHVTLIEQLIHSKKANGKVSLPNHMVALKSYNSLWIEKEFEKKDYQVECSGLVNLPNDKIIEQVKESSDTTNFTCYLNSCELCLPLFIRNRKDGDKMEVKGLGGTKKIKDIFIDSKIPSKQRETWPLVVDSLGKIVWLPGLKKSKFDKTKEEKYDIILRYYEKEEHNE